MSGQDAGNVHERFEGQALGKGEDQGLFLPSSSAEGNFEGFHEGDDLAQSAMSLMLPGPELLNENVYANHSIAPDAFLHGTPAMEPPDSAYGERGQDFPALNVEHSSGVHIGVSPPDLEQDLNFSQQQPQSSDQFHYNPNSPTTLFGLDLSRLHQSTMGGAVDVAPPTDQPPSEHHQPQPPLPPSSRSFTGSAGGLNQPNNLNCHAVPPPPAQPLRSDHLRVQSPPYGQHFPEANNISRRRKRPMPFGNVRPSQFVPPSRAQEMPFMGHPMGPPSNFYPGGPSSSSHSPPFQMFQNSSPQHQHQMAWPQVNHQPSHNHLQVPNWGDRPYVQQSGNHLQNHGAHYAGPSRVRYPINSLYDPAYEAIGLPIDPHLRLFYASHNYGAGNINGRG